MSTHRLENAEDVAFDIWREHMFGKVRLRIKCDEISDYVHHMKLEKESDEYLKEYIGHRNGGFIYREDQLLRRRLSKREVSLTDLMDSLLAPDQTDIEALYECIADAGLPEKQQIICRLRVDGYTQKEVGKLLGVSQPAICKAVKSIKSRSLEERRKSECVLSSHMSG